MSRRGIDERRSRGLEKFPRRLRIRQEIFFRRLLSSGEKLSAPWFFIRHQSNSENSARLGLIVPKKVFRRVVDRNRLKRLARESFRRKARDLPNHDFLVYFLASALSAPPSLLARRLGEAWDRISK